MNTIAARYESPIGPLYIQANDKIQSISTTKPNNFNQEKTSSVIEKVAHYLQNYFAGMNPEINDLLPLLNMDQGTEFQINVWNELTKINFGEYKTYGQIAASIKSPKASRAVGAAVGKNPFLVLLPCHRVLGANKEITGFSAGISKKIQLLNHEKLEFKSR